MPRWSRFLPAMLVYLLAIVVAWWVMQAWAPRSADASPVLMLGMSLMLLLFCTLATILLYRYIVRAHPLSGKRHR
ncbi:hypothetical protein ASF41_22140 [Methylobacterium sp. Leaf111]|nr:hypothetical protein ASF41_22140 [Methylobacterium sp. Leaf111]